MTLCGWGVTAGIVRVWVAGKTVWSPCYTRAISEHFRDRALQSTIHIHVTLLYFTTMVHYKALYTFMLLYVTLQQWCITETKNVQHTLLCNWITSHCRSTYLCYCHHVCSSNLFTICCTTTATSSATVSFCDSFCFYVFTMDYFRSRQVLQKHLGLLVLWWDL